MAYQLSCSRAYVIFPDQGLNLCRLHWQVDSKPLDHQGSPVCVCVLTNEESKEQVSSSDCVIVLGLEKGSRTVGIQR